MYGAETKMGSGGNMEFLKKLIAIGVFAALFGSVAFAQGGATGAISGSVQDASGAAIAGAKVAVIDEGTGQIVRDLTSDSTGLFSAPLLPAGTYSVEASAPGFAPTKFSGVVVRVTENARMTAVLKVTSVKQEVTVSAEVTAVNTTAPVTGQSLGTTEVTDLPMATRNFQTLLALSAGAVSNLNTAMGLGLSLIHI